MLQASASTRSQNIFDSIFDTTPMSPNTLDELQCYLVVDIEDVKDALMWWHERHGSFPGLSRMARDYLSIPGEQFEILHLSKVLNAPIATSVDVERVFSCGHLVLPYVCGRLAIQSTCASLCVGLWSSQGLVRNEDIGAALGPEETEEEGKLPMDWDIIQSGPNVVV